MSREWTEQDSIDLDVEMVLAGARMPLDGEARDRVIRAFAARGLNGIEIAERLRATPKAIQSRARKIGVALNQARIDARTYLTRAECERIIRMPKGTAKTRKPQLMIGVEGRSGGAWLR